jgi:asparagine synthase (glutamine-hydrolysing)
VATWDGRLDNRDDLQLQLGGGLAADTSDAAIALRVFERWGIGGLRLLIGDWSLAVWDPLHRTLHLARDYMGVRPLYYCATDRSVIWSSSLGEIAERADRMDALSDEFVVRFLALRFSTEVTPYQGVRAVSAASCVSFSSEGRQTQQQFWNLDPGTVRYRDRRQYEERLRALWSEAVATRLRVEGTVWAELSGGLDSSSVVCMADALIKGGRVRARAVQPISYATLCSSEGDERRFIAEVETQIGTTTEILGVEDHCDWREDELDGVTPLAATGVSLAGLRRIREQGGRLVLSGRVGDAIMGCEPDNSAAILDDFADGRPLRGLANARRWSRSCRKPLVEIVSRAARRWMSPSLSSETEQVTRLAAAGGALLSPRLRALVSRDAPTLTQGSRTVRASKRDLAASVLGYAFGSRLNMPYIPPFVTYAYPFTHRPLVEFMMAIPGEELSAPGDMRSLMRRSFAGFVPARILGRISKGHYPPSAARAIRPLAESLVPVERLQVVQRGWIDPQSLTAAARAIVDGDARASAEVRRVTRLEQWLSSRDRRAPAVIPDRKEVTCHEVFNA